jgi:hypothetical protein
MLINRCGENNNVVFALESGYANIIPLSNLAMEDGVAVMNGKFVAAVARDEHFFGGEKRFMANRDVKVRFNENVVELMAP